MNDGHFQRVEPGAGTGLVAVIGEIALFVADADGAGALVDIARDAAAAGDPPGRALARAFAAHLAGADGDAVSDFGAVAADTDGWIVLLHGDVAASFVSVDGADVRLSGADSVTWLDRVLPAGIGPVLIAPAGLAPPGSSPASLESGVVPGGWLRAIPASPGDVRTAPVAAAAVVAPSPADDEAGAEPATREVAAVADEPAPLPEPEITVEEPAVEVAAVEEVAPVDEVAVEEVAPAEVAVEEVAPAAPEPAAPDVEVFSLAPDDGEPRDPLPVEGTGGEVAATSKSRATVAITPAAVAGAEPAVEATAPRSLGILVFDNGSTYALDGDYVVGREPDGDDAVLEGRSRPLVLDDPEGSVSRVHAEIRLSGDDVRLIDRGSTNGTQLWDPSREAWDLIPAGEERVIKPGERGSFGQLTFVYERPAEPSATVTPSPRSAQTVAVASAVGVLASSDGAVYPLDRPYVIGHDPSADDAVRQALAAPIVVRDDPQVAAVHARVSIVAGTVHVRDAASPTGTFVAAPGASAWDQVGADPVELKTGWSIRVGHRVLTFRPATS